MQLSLQLGPADSHTNTRRVLLSVGTRYDCMIRLTLGRYALLVCVCVHVLTRKLHYNV